MVINLQDRSKKCRSISDPVPQSLPVLPKPLSILKTAETRTYLSKLIWLGNGGKRPQYGNPETKVVTNEQCRLGLVFVVTRFALMLDKLSYG